jgi:FkbH-like protein
MGPSHPKGRFFYRVQQIITYLSKKGIIVGICSKNNEEDVIEVFKKHPQMALDIENIVIKKVNWQDKASNLRQIAGTLNIGLDSLVFVDDSDFEINLIKEQIPEVLTLQVPKRISSYPDLLLELVYRYFNLETNSDDLKKTEMYKQQFSREESKTNYNSIDDYLKSLQIEIELLEDSFQHLSRIAQLTQKTNQFNLTTKRYTEAEIESFMSSDQYIVVGMSVNDRFGDSGLTGVCILKHHEIQSDKLVIDSFLISCRIIGRNIESKLFSFIAMRAKELGFGNLVASYIPTKKNHQVSEFYTERGMELKKEVDGVKQYSLSLEGYQPLTLDYIKII